MAVVIDGSTIHIKLFCIDWRPRALHPGHRNQDRRLFARRHMGRSFDEGVQTGFMRAPIPADLRIDWTRIAELTFDHDYFGRRGT